MTKVLRAKYVVPNFRNVMLYNFELDQFKVSHEELARVSDMLRTCFEHVSDHFRICVGHVSDMFRTFVGHVSDMFRQTISQKVKNMSSNVKTMTTTCKENINIC